MAPSETQVKTATFRMGSAFGDAIALVTSPLAFMQKNRDVSVSVNTIMVNYVAVLDVIPFIAALIGPLWYYHFGSLVAYSVTFAILTYVFDLIGVYVTGYIIWKLAPTFGATLDQARGTLIAAWILTPAFLIAILDVVPFIAWLTFLGILYGMYILYLGLPVLTNTPKDKVVPYVIGVLIASIIVYVVLATIVGIAADAAFAASIGYI
jgi:hypothetical protein